MLKKIILGTLTLGIMLGSTTISSAQTPRAIAVCKSCHFLDKGVDVKKNNLGQGLKEIVGRKISISGVESLGDTWTEEALNTWLTNPKKVKPSTKMMFRQKKEKKRAKIIEALKAL